MKQPAGRTAPVLVEGPDQPGVQKGTGASAALGWSLLNTGVAKLGTLGIGIVLARVLGPDSYGTFAVAMVALLAVLTFNELGVSLAIVRWPGDPARIAPTVTTISVLGSVVFSWGPWPPLRGLQRPWVTPAPQTWSASWSAASW